MNDHKPKETEDKYFKPVSMFFFLQIHWAGFYSYNNSNNEEDTSAYIKVQKWKPGMAKWYHKMLPVNCKNLIKINQTKFYFQIEFPFSQKGR